MPSSSLRPLLRTSSHLPSPSPTYICHQCRHARLLRGPKRPYTFTQLVTLSDGSAFTMRTTSPTPVYRSTRDTRNAPLWNPRSKELLNVEEDEAGRLAGFRSRFGGGFDVRRDDNEDSVEAKGREGDVKEEGEREERKAEERKAREVVEQEDDEGWDFGEEDENMLDLISRFGQEEGGGKKGGEVVKKRK